jgi:hypothetical protein
MKNQPLNSSDQSKILIFSILLAPAVFFIVGMIPALFLAFGIFMMKKHEDFSHITTAVRNFRGYTLLLLLGSILFAAYFATTLNEEDSWERHDEEFIVSLVAISICVVYLIAVKILFLNPLANHDSWVETNGIFSNKTQSARVPTNAVEMNIIKGERLKQYSVADELLKWAKLKEDGHISEDEFNEARAKLLKRS